MSLSGEPVERARLQRMAQSIVHRGPDDEGFFCEGPVGFAFRRLSILDLSPSGHQPMVSEDGDVVLVFNGEIFNYIELRRELQSRGHRFRSTGDTEVLLHAYAEWGSDALPRLNGMWAFVLYDRRRRILFGSRDRFGVKPLYFARSAERVVFGSEIKALLASGLLAARTNWRAAARFLAHGQLDTDQQCFYEGIEQLPPGTSFTLGLDGTWQVTRFWNLDAAAAAQRVTDPAAQFRETFADAVRIRTRSDVPVGVCLSGGLDSTSIICAMANGREDAGAGSALEAFCFMAPEYDESRYIETTLRETGARLNRLEIEPRELFDSLPQVLHHHDEPVHTMTALIGYRLMALAASRGVRVILNGQGADETVAGYGSNFVHYWHTLAARGDWRLLWRELVAHASTAGVSPRDLLRRVLRFELRSALGALPLYRAAGRARRRRALASAPWVTPELLENLEHEADERSGLTLDEVLRREVGRSPLPLYLRVEDRNSMAHSVEARLPFMDYRLVSLAFALPAEWKMRGPLNKFVLREAMRGVIPENVRSRIDKMGFPTPAASWFRNELYEPVRELLDSQHARSRGIYESRVLLRALDEHRAGRPGLYPLLSNAVILESWLRSREIAPATHVTPAVHTTRRFGTP